MCLLSIGLDTLGLLLRIWLWISVPMAVIILMVATWMNYLRDVRPKGDLKLAVEGLGGEVSPGGGDTYIQRDGLVGGASSEEELTATGGETIYQGILWMKQKYEQYRELADRRYEQLREELGRSEHRYQDLVAKGLGDQLAEARKQLEAKQAIIEEMETQLRSERIKVEELLQKAIPELGK